MPAIKRQRPFPLLAGALLAASALAGMSSAAHAEQPQQNWVDPESNVRAGQLDVPLNKSQMLTVDQPVGRVMVGNQEIADIMPITTRSIYVLGRKLGTTSLTIFDKADRVMAVVDVAVGPDIVSLQRQLVQLVPGEKIDAHISNDSIVLTGIASNAPAIDRAVQLARTYSGDNVVNMVSLGASQQVLLEVRFAEVQRNVAKDLGINHTALNSDQSFVGGVGNNGIAGVPLTVRQSTVGNSSSTNAFGNAEVFGDTLTTITTPPGTSTNVTRFGGSGGAGVSGNASQGTSSSQIRTNAGSGGLDTILPTAGFGAIGFISHLAGLRISTTLDALERKGLVKTLAQPTLIALSGETASFLAGGEFPIPVVQNGSIGGGAAQVTVEFKPFGVSLAFTPTVLADGMINLIVEPEVSSIDSSASVQLNGLVIPGLRTRRANTVLELRDGEAFAIAGLMQNDFATTVRQIPLLGSIPIIGSLFRSSGFQRGETELVIVVIPRLVKPVRPDQIKLPTDRVGDASEGDLFLMGRTDKAVPIIPEPETGGAAPADTSTSPGGAGYEY